MGQFAFPFRETTMGELDAPIRELIHAAQHAAQHAYAPYSHFSVGAALRLADGSIRTGANHENASYPAGICAERAVLSTLDMNDPAQKVAAIAISYSGGHVDAPLSPCGICRQALLEVQMVQGSAITIYMCSPGGRVIEVADAGNLLPFFFSGTHLA